MCQAFVIGSKTPQLTRAAVAWPRCSPGCELCRAACTGRAAECNEWSGNAWSCSPVQSFVQTQLGLDAESKHPLLLFPDFSKYFGKCVESCFREEGFPGAAQLWVLLSAAVTWCPVCTAHPSLSIRVIPGSILAVRFMPRSSPRGQPGGSHRPRCSLVVGAPNIHETAAK